MLQRLHRASALLLLAAVAQRDGEKIREKVPAVDVVFGTSTCKLSACQYFSPALLEASSRSEEGGGPHRSAKQLRQQYHAWVPITPPAHFCTYCIVRGRERSRTLRLLLVSASVLQMVPVIIFWSKR